MDRRFDRLQDELVQIIAADILRERVELGGQMPVPHNIIEDANHLVDAFLTELEKSNRK